MDKEKSTTNTEAKETNIKNRSVKRSFERKALVVLSIFFVAVILGGWAYALKLRQTVSQNNAVTHVDPRALIEVERIRNLAESQIGNGRSFFLLGSRSLFDKQKQDKQDLTEALANFEKQYSLPQVPEIMKRIDAIEQHQQEVFDQAMEFRGKQTESKIVGQFYQAKTAPLLKQLNDSLDEIVQIHKAELNRARTEAKRAAQDAEVQIPRGMAWFTGLLILIFLAMSLLVLRVLRERQRQLAERDRLYAEGKRAALDRDEVIAAISEDFKEPLQAINSLAADLKGAANMDEVAEIAELIKGGTLDLEHIVKDIYDQKKADMHSLILRMDQLGIDEILDEARLLLQPLAKQRDVRLQFESVNPPVLAFFDRERVIRVLWNLIGNAIKFSPKHSRVVVKVRSDQQFVNISVEDNGPGIPEKQLMQIFDHFWQARRTSDQGPGIGLAVVKTIVEAHGGTVRVTSHNHGSTFTFSLPRRRPVGAHLRRPTAPAVKIRKAKRQGESFQEGLHH